MTIIALAGGVHTKHEVRCGANVACIVAVAKRDCKANPQDRHHCKIAWRNRHPSDPPKPAPDPPVQAPASIMTAFDWCVAGHESTWGADVVGPGSYGWFQFTTTTYDTALEMMAARGMNVAGWDPDPLTAPLWQQVAVFNFYEPLDPGAWPNSVPACGG